MPQSNANSQEKHSDLHDGQCVDDIAQSKPLARNCLAACETKFACQRKCHPLSPLTIQKINALIAHWWSRISMIPSSIQLRDF